MLPDGRFKLFERLHQSCGGATGERITTSKSGLVGSIAALPDGVHFVVGLAAHLLYHVDGTLVHVFEHSDPDDLEIRRRETPGTTF